MVGEREERGGGDNERRSECQSVREEERKGGAESECQSVEGK